jgi:importin subunit alpha-1
MLRVLHSRSSLCACVALLRLCGRSKPPPQFELVAPALPLLAQLLHSKDDEVVTHACLSLSYLSTDRTPDNVQIEAVLRAGVAEQLVAILQRDDWSLVALALRAVSAHVMRAL